MTLKQKDKLLRLALTAFGVIFCLIYPVGLVWPSGWVWHGGHGQYYLQMICGVYAVLGIFLVAGARDPYSNRSLISTMDTNSGTSPAMYPRCFWSPPCFGSCLPQASRGTAAYSSSRTHLHSRLSEVRSLVDAPGLTHCAARPDPGQVQQKRPIR